MIAWLRLACFLILLILAALVVRADYLLNQPLVLSQPVVFEIHRGDSLWQVSRDFKAKGWFNQPILFIAYSYWRGGTRYLHSGEYALRPGMTVTEVINNFLSGVVLQHAFVIIPGWSFRQLMCAVVHNRFLDASHLFANSDDIMSQLGVPEKQAEGQFFPDTYFFPRGFDALALLAQAQQRMQKILMELWRKRAANLPYTSVEQVLIVASLVEKEVRVAEERVKVAGVILRRLTRHMLLQLDPTVIYALGRNFTGKLSKQDLKINSPYNTYRYKGLPPAPIAIPSAASIDAALHPEDSSALYFVARGDGSHVFSATLAEHQRAVRRYILHTK